MQNAKFRSSKSMSMRPRKAMTKKYVTQPSFKYVWRPAKSVLKSMIKIKSKKINEKNSRSTHIIGEQPKNEGPSTLEKVMT